MPRLMITGIEGFTGRYLERHFIAKGFDVYGTVLHHPSKPRHLRCDITSCDEVTEAVLRIKPDMVIHTAAASFVADNNVAKMYNVNVLGTDHVLHALTQLSYRPQKVIVASSATVYGNQTKEILDETTPPAPVNHYGCSKLAMEHIASTYFDALPLIITRPFNYTGVGQEERFLVPKIVAHYKARKNVIELGNVHIAREFNDVSFVVEAYDRLLRSDATSLIVNIATQRPVKLLTLIEMMNDIAGYTIKIRTNPALVRENDIVSLCGSSRKLYDVIGMLPPSDIYQTLKTMYDA